MLVQVKNQAEDSPEHVSMKLVLKAVKQQGRIEDWQVVSIKQDDFCEAGGVKGKCLEGVASDVG